MSREYVSCADTAKLIRAALKEALSGVKFSVQSKTYSGGASITVGWVDGPNEAQVKAVAGRFAGATFDGMIDLKSSVTSLYNGKEVRFGADFVFYRREFSDAAVEKAIDSVFAKYVGNFKADGIAKPALEDFRKGKLWNVQLSGLHNYGNQSVQADIHAWLGKKSDRGVVANSAVAEAVA
jgi:Large polyvalent protein associated domain 29